METFHWRPTVAEVNLHAITHNINELRRFLNGETKLMTVVKADAYGHGILPVAETALAGGADWLGVAIAEEAMLLRRNGIAAPILVLGASQPEAMEAMVSEDVSVTVFNPDALLAMQRAAKRMGKRAKAHLKLDTGMHRLGVMEEDELHELLALWKNIPEVEMEGVFSHFAAADEEDAMYSEMQLARFEGMRAIIQAAGFQPMAHLANTAGAVAMAGAQYDMVRMGIGLYGYPPSAFVGKMIQYRPAMELRSALSRVFLLRKGECIGYGCTYRAAKDMQVGIVPIGYGDGYRRIFSPGGYMLVKGKKAPLVGRICMDQCAIDLSGIPGVDIGEPVVLLGEQGGDVITAEDWAAWANSISYEMLLGLTARVPRKYIGANDGAQGASS